jgi:hypothetical protein
LLPDLTLSPVCENCQEILTNRITQNSKPKT